MPKFYDFQTTILNSATRISKQEQRRKRYEYLMSSKHAHIARRTMRGEHFEPRKPEINISN